MFTQPYPTLSTPQTAVHQAPLSMGFPRQEYWNCLPLPPPRDLPNPGFELVSLASAALAGRFLTTASPGKYHKGPGTSLQPEGSFTPFGWGEGKRHDASRCLVLVPPGMFIPMAGGPQTDLAVHERQVLVNVTQDLHVAKFNGCCSFLVYL